MILLSLEVEGRKFDVRLVKRKQAKHIKLTWGRQQQDLQLSTPWHISVREINDFLDRARPWIAKKLPERPESVPFDHGASIPILGKQYALHVDTSASQRIAFDGSQLVVRGPSNCVDLVVHSFLRKELAHFCSEQSHHYAQSIGAVLQNIRVRNMRSRWGSCSSSGNLCFAYRLIFAPREIVQYVCAHEVAHLKEMNHSPAFWKEVAHLYPHYESARAWLKKEGKNLFRYG